ncbi:hypothetical protein [Umezawaea tangerina]|uniref:Uncharacterized protein n=1 Tax=Umezawaea tangerina TaxID=84725 RepID=A0A2T0SKU0_9PSEU|nr:hypothetical protein [Umezawaea tangerina]PRY34029.1 hypothetical protein CLV43_11855 [Umezawaea tangerina]
MARNTGSPSANPSANPNPNPGSPPPAPPPPPQQSVPAGYTGTSGFSVTEGSLQTLQKQAGDLESGYQRIASQLSSQTLKLNALGMFGIPMTVAVNDSNGKSIDKANQAAETMAKVSDGVKATGETQTKTDQMVADEFGKIVPDSGAKNPNGAPNTAPPPQQQSGPQVSKTDPPPGATNPAPAVTPATPGPDVNKVQPPPGATNPPPAAPPVNTGPPTNQYTPPPGADTTNPAAAPPPPPGGQHANPYTPPPGADTTSPAAAPPPPAAPPVSAYVPPPGDNKVPTPNVPTPQGGPQVNPYTPPPGANSNPAPAAPKPQSAPPIESYVPPPGNNKVPTPNVPSPQAAPPVTSYTPPPGSQGTTNASWTPPPIPDPVAHVPGVPGTPSPTGPAMPNNAPNSSIISQMPPIPGANGPVKPNDRPNLPNARPPGGGPPRPGVVPNIPGVDGAPKPEFSKPSTSAFDSLKPINTAFPPQGAPIPPPFAPVAPPSSPTDPMPVTGPFPPAEAPPVPPVKPVLANPNLLDLMNPAPGVDHHAPEAFPLTTIDGKPTTDLSDFSNMPPKQQQMWIDNLKNLLASKENGAFLWSGNVWNADGERISVMYEAEAQAHGMGRNTLEGRLDDLGMKMPGWKPGDVAVQNLWDNASSSVAHGASGDVYVLLGPSRRPDNVFDMNEFPILEQNDGVRRVIAIDVMKNNAETVILDKGPRPPRH